MIELDQKVWDGLVYEFAKSLSKGRTIEQALMCFIEDYWTELDTLSSKAGLKEDEEEYLDVYFERKMNSIWEYVYNLNAQISDLKKQVNLLEQLKPYGPTPKYPNNLPPQVGFPYSGGCDPTPNYIPPWKIAPHANGNVPLSSFGGIGSVGTAGDWGSGGIGANLHTGAGSNGGDFYTTGYMQLTDKKYTPKYTPEQIDEWSKIRFDDPSVRR